MEKTEFPTRSRQEELKEQGIAPCSRFAAACLSAAGVLIWLGLDHKRCGAFVSSARRVMEEPSAAWDAAPTLEFAQAAWALFVIPAAIVACISMMAALFQTRFLFRLANCAFSPNRVFCLRPLIKGALLKGVLISFFWAGLGALLAGALVRRIAPVLLSALNFDQSLFVGLAQRTIEAGLPVIAPLLIFMGLVAWSLVRLRFLFAYRMSKQEIEAEEREQ